jgi:hypothetical protein
VVVDAISVGVIVGMTVMVGVTDAVAGEVETGRGVGMFPIG